MHRMASLIFHQNHNYSFLFQYCNGFKLFQLKQSPSAVSSPMLSFDRRLRRKLQSTDFLRRRRSRATGVSAGEGAGTTATAFAGIRGDRRSSKKRVFPQGHTMATTATASWTRGSQTSVTVRLWPRGGMLEALTRSILPLLSDT